MARKEKRFKITVKQLVDDEDLDSDDFDDNPAGEHFFNGVDEEDALDSFHSNIPIACLDDFEITCEEENN